MQHEDNWNDASLVCKVTSVGITVNSFRADILTLWYSEPSEDDMDNFEEDMQTLLNMEPGSNVYLSMFEEGGAEVRRTETEWLLFEIPLYGGDPRFEGTFQKETLSDLLYIINTWT